jgi:hypothetical protein
MTTPMAGVSAGVAQLCLLGKKAEVDHLVVVNSENAPQQWRSFRHHLQAIVRRQENWLGNLDSNQDSGSSFIRYSSRFLILVEKPKSQGLRLVWPTTDRPPKPIEQTAMGQSRASYIVSVDPFDCYLRSGRRVAASFRSFDSTIIACSTPNGVFLQRNYRIDRLIGSTVAQGSGGRYRRISGTIFGRSPRLPPAGPAGSRAPSVPDDPRRRYRIFRSGAD